MGRKILWGLAIICFAITGTFASSGPAFGAKKPFIFGLLLVGPYNDHGYSQAHFDGGKYVEKKVPDTKMIYIDKVNPADRAGGRPDLNGVGAVQLGEVLLRHTSMSTR